MGKMFIRIMGLVSLLAVAWHGPTQAADFSVWMDVWLKATSSKSGVQGPVLPTGGKVETDKRRAGSVFVKIASCDSAAESCTLDVCNYDAESAAWILHSNVAATILSGNYLDFLTILELTYERPAGDLVEVKIPLRIRGGINRGLPASIISASINSVGGYYVETTFNNPVDKVPVDRSIGTVTLNGSLVPVVQVGRKVPPACTP